MSGVESVEQVLKPAKLSASFLIVEIQKSEGWKGKIFCAQRNDRKICPNDVDGAVVSEDIKYKDKEYSVAVIVGVKKLCYVYSGSCN